MSKGHKQNMEHPDGRRRRARVDSAASVPPRISVAADDDIPDTKPCLHALLCSAYISLRGCLKLALLSEVEFTQPLT